MKRKCLILECQKQIQKVKYTDIYYLKYQEGSISIGMADDKNLLCCLSLKEIENLLSDDFIKINRNVIINLRYLTAYIKASRKVLLENGLQFYVSRRNVTPLLIKIKAEI